ncbi:MAG: hypothetical protein OHK0056_26670 [Bacteriovoracaceae bacterium]
MNKYFALFLSFISLNIFANSEIIDECQEQIKSLCGSKGIVECHKEHAKNELMLNCIAILLPENTVPKSVNDLKSEKLFDAGTANCFETINKACGSMDVNECFEKKGNLFQTKCRELVVEIEEQRNKMKELGGDCFSKAFLNCERQVEIPLSSYNLFVSGVSQHQRCMKDFVLSNSQCIAPVKTIISKKKEELEKAKESKKTEESKKKEEKKS